MITCPWCGTNYQKFQSNCNNCGGSLPLPVETVPVVTDATEEQERPLSPPLPPREVPQKVVNRMLITDGIAITGGIFLLLGGIFFIVGLALVIPIITLPVGLPFAGMGFVFLVIGGFLLYQRYQHAQQTLDILRHGQAALGEITAVSQNFTVRINNRHPWVIQYDFQVHGQAYSGRLSTLSQPDLSQQPGKPVYVLYRLDEPEKSTLFPSPYGYFGL